MPKIKITVVKKVNNKDMFGDNPPVAFTATPECDRVEMGQEFISNQGECPSGFCSWAFADIQRDITHLLFGGNCSFMTTQGTNLVCCTDGFRPVIFKLERTED